MATEEITLATGENVVTLKELLRPGLKAIFVGLNPAPKSVRLGHYWQGSHGTRRWTLLREFGITPSLPRGAEDDQAFELGYGFCDLVRRPTASSQQLTREELRVAPADLLARPAATGDRPPIVFTYASARKCAEHVLTARGYGIHQMPSPYASHSQSRTRMQELQKLLSISIGV